MEKKHLFRQLRVTEAESGVFVNREGRQLLSFSGNDYLGLAQHPKVIAAAQKALREYGAGAGASRLITGNHPLYEVCEKKLAAWNDSAAACIFGSGYLANLGTIAALMGKDDLVIADKLSHACLLDGARLGGATLLRFAHNSIERCEEILKNHRKKYNNCLLVTEAVFSMDGDSAPLNDLYDLAEEYDAWLMVDEAHLLAKHKSVAKAHIRTSTLSKALGAYGGYVCGSDALIDYLKSSARSLIYSTALPASVIAAASAAIDIIVQQPELADVPIKRANLFASLMGLPKTDSAIVPFIVGSAEQALHMSEQLEDKGFLVTAIRPPTVPPGTSRLRFTFSALHTEEQVYALAQAIQLLEIRSA